MKAAYAVRARTVERRRRLPRLCLAAMLGAACGCDAVVAPRVTPPQVLAGAVAPNPHNVISAVVSTRARLADSVAVRYGAAGEPLHSTSAAVAAGDEPVTIPLFGLLPDTTYALQVVAWGGGRIVAGDTLTFVTGPLPPDLPAFTTSGTDPTPGYVVFAADRYGVVIDNSGRVVWYHWFPEGPGLNFQVQPTGRYMARPPPAGPSEPGAWIEIDPLGDVTRTLGCVGERLPRFHDLLAEPDGAYWILCDEARTMDLSPLGGHAGARVVGTVVQHVSGTGDLLFQWSAFDHFDIADLDPAERAGAVVNWTHGNALDLDADGNLLLSFRNLSEVTKVDTRTGHVVWRLGGRRNEFTFVGTNSPPFLRQHGLRVTGPHEFLLLDNLGEPAGSRVERYAIDAQARTARLVASHASSPAVLAQLGGTTQPLPEGRVLASFGSAGRVEEYDAAGNVLWKIHQPGYVFRAQRIRSLEAPGVGFSR